MTEAPILAGASERISRYRQSAITVRVVDAGGKPVRDAEVKVEQLSHGFLFGCNLFLLNRLPSPELEQQYRDRFAALFNYATLPFYWAGFEGEKGKPQYERIDAMVEWCKARGIACKGHPLVWNHQAGVPGWLPSDLGAIRALSDARVSEIVSRCRGRIDRWDVVNEAADPFRAGFGNLMTDMWKQAGVMPLTVASFQLARKANPEATLLINDYRTDPAYERVVEQLVGEGGKPLYDVIGIQSHMHGGAWPVQRVWEVCERFSRFRVPLHFTETTIVSGPKTDSGWNTTPEGEQRQAEAVVKLYTTLFSHPAVEALTWWDFADRGAWQQAPAGFLRKDLSPKPAYDQLLELVKHKWWTRATKSAGETGALSLRAFHGQHRLTAISPAGQSVSQDVHVGKQGGEFTLTLR
jgi:GH35 family endo-1,4-beta-xylanase